MWLTQHPVLERLDPPYNYNVFQGDVDGFVRAIKDALSHPIERYVNTGVHLIVIRDRAYIANVQLCARADAYVIG
jgi:hypothetical protein